MAACDPGHSYARRVSISALSGPVQRRVLGRGGSTETAMTSDAASPRALMRVIGLFDALAAAEEGLALVELAQMLDSPKSSLLMLLRPLVSSGHLLHGGARDRLGPGAFRMASGILAGRRQPEEIRVVLERHGLLSAV